MTSTSVEESNLDSDIDGVPAEPDIDPYRIAYLRGGAREILKLRLYELAQMGYLTVREQKCWYGTIQWLAAAPDSPDWRELPLPDQNLLEFFETPRSVREIFTMPFPPELVDACRSYRQDLKRIGLLKGWISSDDQISKFLRVGFAGLLFLSLVLNFIMGAKAPIFWVAFVAVFLLVFFSPLVAYRPSRKGKRYLKWLLSKYRSYVNFNAETWDLTPPPKRLTLVSILGFGILADSPADAFASLFEKKGGAEYNTSSGGGCGGGCGGCGGGGCGGCGGCGG